jgi:tRNA1(Val) A37 N6-methylase TrmN6
MADRVLPLLPATSADVFLGDKITVRQPVSGYRAGIDAVLLAAVAQAMADGRGRILDVGSGAGTVGLCVAARLPGIDVVLVERESSLAAIARDNIQHNGFAARMTLVEADVVQPLHDTAAKLLPADTFTHVLSQIRPITIV